MKFKCTECGREVVNIVFENKSLTSLPNLTHFPSSWNKAIIDEAVENNTKQVSNVIAECDNCGTVWRAKDATELRALMITQGVLI